MKIRAVIWSTVLFCSLFFLWSVSVPTAQAAQSKTKQAKPESSAAKPGRADVAPASQRQENKGAKPVENPLKACLSKIPQDSSAGQRLLAEQGCRSEQEVRSSRHGAPQF